MKGGKKGKRWALLLTVLLVVGLIGSFIVADSFIGGRSYR